VATSSPLLPSFGKRFWNFNNGEMDPSKCTRWEETFVISSPSKVINVNFGPKEASPQTPEPLPKSLQKLKDKVLLSLCQTENERQLPKCKNCAVHYECVQCLWCMKCCKPQCRNCIGVISQQESDNWLCISCELGPEEEEEEENYDYSSDDDEEVSLGHKRLNRFCYEEEMECAMKKYRRCDMVQ